MRQLTYMKHNTTALITKQNSHKFRDSHTATYTDSGIEYRSRSIEGAYNRSLGLLKFTHVMIYKK